MLRHLRERRHEYRRENRSTLVYPPRFLAVASLLLGFSECMPRTSYAARDTSSPGKGLTYREPAVPINPTVPSFQVEGMRGEGGAPLIRAFHRAVWWLSMLSRPTSTEIVPRQPDHACAL